MESLERFQQSRAVIEDFSSTTLAAIPSDLGRLWYISSLRHSANLHRQTLTTVKPEDANRADIRFVQLVLLGKFGN